MTGDDLRDMLKKVFLPEEIEALAREYGVVERARQLDVVMFVAALVLAGGTHEGGRQYDVLRMYIESGAPRVVRGSFYSWFEAPLERLMAELLRRAIVIAQQVPKLLPGILRGVSDWRIVDSTTVKLHGALIKEWPGAGDYAALKIHKEWSVGTGNLHSYTLSPAREHDAPHLVVDEARRGTGLIVDLGYASLRFLSECETHDVRYVVRLKDNWKPRVDRIVRGAAPKGIVAAEDFDVLLDQDLILREGNAIDADVTVGRGSRQVLSRLVGVPTPKGYCFFLTNLPRGTHGPLQVGDIYRVRWEIEVDNKVEKAGTRLDEMDARKPVSVRILVMAAMLSATMARIVVQREKLAIVANKGGVGRGQSLRRPLHALLVVRAMKACFPLVFKHLSNEQTSTSEWSNLMGTLRLLGHDPNWRKRPSVLDKIQGLTGAPGRPRDKRLARGATD